MEIQRRRVSSQDLQIHNAIIVLTHRSEVFLQVGAARKLALGVPPLNAPSLKRKHKQRTAAQATTVIFIHEQSVTNTFDGCTMADYDHIAGGPCVPY